MALTSSLEAPMAAVDMDHDEAGTADAQVPEIRKWVTNLRKYTC